MQKPGSYQQLASIIKIKGGRAWGVELLIRKMGHVAGSLSFRDKKSTGSIMDGMEARPTKLHFPINPGKLRAAISGETGKKSPTKKERHPHFWGRPNKFQPGPQTGAGNPGLKNTDPDEKKKNITNWLWSKMMVLIAGGLVVGPCIRSKPKRARISIEVRQKSTSKEVWIAQETHRERRGCLDGRENGSQHGANFLMCWKSATTPWDRGRTLNKKSSKKDGVASSTRIVWGVTTFGDFTVKRNWEKKKNRERK